MRLHRPAPGRPALGACCWHPGPAPAAAAEPRACCCLGRVGRLVERGKRAHPSQLQDPQHLTLLSPVMPRAGRPLAAAWLLAAALSSDAAQQQWQQQWQPQQQHRPQQHGMWFWLQLALHAWLAGMVLAGLLQRGTESLCCCQVGGTVCEATWRCCVMCDRTPVVFVDAFVGDHALSSCLAWTDRCELSTASGAITCHETRRIILPFPSFQRSLQPAACSRSGSVISSSSPPTPHQPRTRCGGRPRQLTQ